MPARRESENASVRSITLQSTAPASIGTPLAIPMRTTSPPTIDAERFRPAPCTHASASRNGNPLRDIDRIPPLAMPIVQPRVMTAIGKAIGGMLTRAARIS